MSAKWKKGNSQLLSDSHAPGTSSAHCRSLTLEILGNRDQRAHIRGLQGDDAQVVVDYLDIVSREAGLSAEEQKQALSLLCKLAKSADVFPRCYELTGINYDMEVVDGGRFADIYRGRYKGQMLSLKVVRAFLKQESNEILKGHVQELALWAQLRHKNILPFYGVFPLGASPRICLVSPWMEKGNLYAHLRKFPQTPRMPFISDIADGLLYLHDLHIVHSDLKSQNILVSDDGRALIADFGLSFVKATTTSTAAGGTTRFMAPELLFQGGKVTEQCDIWSFAYLCYEILTNKVPFYQYTDTQIIFILLRKETPLRLSHSDGASQELDGRVWNLLQSCWKYVPQDRPSCRVVRDQIASFGIPDGRNISTLSIHSGPDFWQTMRENSGDRLDYALLEEVLRHVSGEIPTTLPQRPTRTGQSLFLYPEFKTYLGRAALLLFWLLCLCIYHRLSGTHRSLHEAAAFGYFYQTREQAQISALLANVQQPGHSRSDPNNLIGKHSDVARNIVSDLVDRRHGTMEPMGTDDAIPPTLSISQGVADEHYDEFVQFSLQRCKLDPECSFGSSPIGDDNGDEGTTDNIDAFSGSNPKILGNSWEGESSSVEDLVYIRCPENPDPTQELDDFIKFVKTL